MALAMKKLLFGVKTPPTLGTISNRGRNGVSHEEVLFGVKTPPTLGTISNRGRNGVSHEEVAIQR
jgi:hypothetical protein